MSRQMRVRRLRRSASVRPRSVRSKEASIGCGRHYPLVAEPRPGRGPVTRTLSQVEEMVRWSVPAP